MRRPCWPRRAAWRRVAAAVVSSPVHSSPLLSSLLHEERDLLEVEPRRRDLALELRRRTDVGARVAVGKLVEDFGFDGDVHIDYVAAPGTALSPDDFIETRGRLEFLGVARPVKMRKVEYMQRTAFPLDQLLGEDGL